MSLKSLIRRRRPPSDSRGLDMPFRGIRESRRDDFDADLAWLAELLDDLEVS